MIPLDNVGYKPSSAKFLHIGHIMGCMVYIASSGSDYTWHKLPVLFIFYQCKLKLKLATNFMLYQNNKINNSTVNKSYAKKFVLKH